MPERLQRLLIEASALMILGVMLGLITNSKLMAAQSEPPSIVKFTQPIPTDDSQSVLSVDAVLLSKADAGDPKAQLIAAIVFEKSPDFNEQKKGKAWLQKASDNGEPTAQFILGWDHYNSTPQDFKNADSLFRLASQHINVIDFKLVEESEELKIFIAMSRQKMGGLLFYLGSLYEEGKDLPQDYTQAGVWYRAGAELGHRDAQSALALLYESGKGVGQDYSSAIYWLRKAADQKQGDALFNLGVLYFQGHGVPQDYQKALEWFRKAMAQGNYVALYNVGSMYAQGLGVEQSDGNAYLCFSIAAARLQGQQQVNAEKARDFAASQLTPEQLSIAQKNASKLFDLLPPNIEIK